MGVWGREGGWGDTGARVPLRARPRGAAHAAAEIQQLRIGTCMERCSAGGGRSPRASLHTAATLLWQFAAPAAPCQNCVRRCCV